MTNTVTTNVISTMSTNSEYKKVRYKMDCFILHTLLLVIISLFIIAIIMQNIGQNKKILA